MAPGQRVARRCAGRRASPACRCAGPAAARCSRSTQGAGLPAGDGEQQAHATIRSITRPAARLGGASPISIGRRKPRAPPPLRPPRRAHGPAPAAAPGRPRRRGRRARVRPTAGSIDVARRRAGRRRARPPRARPRARRSPRTKPARAAGAAATTGAAGRCARASREKVARAAERRDHALEPLRRRAAVERPLQLRARRRRDRRARPRSDQQLGGERERHLVQPRVAARAGEIIDRVEDLDRIAGGAGERLVHVGDQRDRRQAGAGRRRRRCSRASSRAPSQRRHEGAGAASSRPSPAPSRPAASFFDRIEAVISGIDSTVAVTSRIA